MLKMHTDLSETIELFKINSCRYRRQKENCYHGAKSNAEEILELVNDRDESYTVEFWKNRSEETESVSNGGANRVLME